MNTTSFDDLAAEIYQEDPQLAVDVLNDCLRDGDMGELLVHLRQMTKAFGGVGAVAREAGLHEKTLYKTLSRDGNPNLRTLVNLAGVMGMRLAFVPCKAEQVSPA